MSEKISEKKYGAKPWEDIIASGAVNNS